MIPPSAIRDTSLHDVVHELPLNHDVAEHILSFTDKFVVPTTDPDLFWFTLGRETCNLYIWNHHCPCTPVTRSESLLKLQSNSTCINFSSI